MAWMVRGEIKKRTDELLIAGKKWVEATERLIAAMERHNQALEKVSEKL